MEGSLPSVDYLVLGHVTQDVTPSGPQPGGTVTFASLTARAMGLRAGMVTATAGGMLPEILSGIPAVALASEHSSTFENVYTEGHRTQYVRGVADNIALEHIPPEWRSTPVVHLGPLVQDVDVALVEQLAHTFVGLTPQGWMRHWDASGRVSQIGWAEARRGLRGAAATVVSREDVAEDEGLIRQWADWAKVLVVTSGPGGATVYTGGRSKHFPAPRVPEVDPTGAGDIFAAVYFAVLQATGDPWAAAEPAVELASESVKHAALESIPSAAAAQSALHGLLSKSS